MTYVSRCLTLLVRTAAIVTLLPLFGQREKPNGHSVCFVPHHQPPYVVSHLVCACSGLEPTAAPGTIQARATALTAGVLNQSTLALFLLDARYGWPPCLSVTSMLHCIKLLPSYTAPLCHTRCHSKNGSSQGLVRTRTIPCSQGTDGVAVDWLWTQDAF